MKLNFKTVILIILSIISTSIIANSNDKNLLDNNKRQTSLLIQNNLKSAVLYMSLLGGYEIKNFGDITLAYSDTPGPDYNMIFYYSNSKNDVENLKQALAYSQQKRFPFMLVRDEKIINKDSNDIINVYNYNKVGSATKMAITHADVNFNDVEFPIIKEVDNNELLNIHCDIVDQSFDRVPGSSKLFIGSMKGLLSQKSESELKLYLAYYDVKGKLEPVAAAMLYLPKDKKILAGHYAWAVKPEFREKGIMTGFVKKMILIAKQHGYSASVAQCYDASVRLAERVGFKKYGQLELYVNAKEATS